MSAALFPTPRSEDSQQTGGHRGKADTLTSFARMLPTPTAAMADKKGADYARQHRAGGGRAPDLQTYAMMFPTATADDTGHRSARYAQGGTALSTVTGGLLNPTWVEWLMGFPLGWTDCDASATPSCRKSSQ